VKCRAAIYGLDGQQWAGATQVKATLVEIQRIIAGFKNPSLMYSSQPTVEGLRYMTTRAEADVIALKLGSRVAVFGKSNQALTACLADESTTTAAQALMAVTRQVDYMKSIGY
jgi:profilin